MGKIMIGVVAVLILIVPFIIIFQLNQADIVINFDEDDPFKNKCFLGQSECVYKAIFPEIELREDDTYWWILGENVWCVKTERTVEEQVADPIGVITEETEVSCNDFAMFDKSEWDFTIIPPDRSEGVSSGQVDTYIFTMKGI